MPRIKSYHFIFFLVGMAISILLSYQWRMSKNVPINPYLQQRQALVDQVNQAREERDLLKAKLNDLRVQFDRTAGGHEVAPFKEELDMARIGAGLADVAGLGIEVTLNDSKKAVQPGENPNLYVLHDEDVLNVINELKAAGAEALSINGQRMLATSEIRCIGPTILTNKSYRLTPPFVIRALGNQDNMINSLQMRGGLIEQLNFWGIQVSVRRVDNLVVPAYNGTIKFDFADPLI